MPRGTFRRGCGSRSRVDHRHRATGHRTRGPFRTLPDSWGTPAALGPCSCNREKSALNPFRPMRNRALEAAERTIVRPLDRDRSLQSPGDFLESSRIHLLLGAVTERFAAGGKVRGISGSRGAWPETLSRATVASAGVRRPRRASISFCTETSWLSPNWLRSSSRCSRLSEGASNWRASASRRCAHPRTMGAQVRHLPALARWALPRVRTLPQSPGRPRGRSVSGSGRALGRSRPGGGSSGTSPSASARHRAAAASTARGPAERVIVRALRRPTPLRIEDRRLKESRQSA